MYLFFFLCRFYFCSLYAGIDFVMCRSLLFGVGVIWLICSLFVSVGGFRCRVVRISSFRWNFFVCLCFNSVFEDLWSDVGPFVGFVFRSVYCFVFEQSVANKWLL